MQAKTSTALLVAIFALAPSTALACGPSDGEIIVALTIVLTMLGVVLTGVALSIYGAVRVVRRRRARNATVII